MQLATILYSFGKCKFRNEDSISSNCKLYTLIIMLWLVSAFVARMDIVVGMTCGRGQLLYCKAKKSLSKENKALSS